MRTTIALTLLALVASNAAGQVLVQPPAQPSVPKPEIVINGQPKDVKSALTPEQQKELADLKAWFLNYHTAPDAAKVGKALQDLARLGEMNNGSRGWPSAAIIAALLRTHPDQTAEWCTLFEVAAEPSRYWFFTGVWFADTEPAKKVLADLAALPDGNARKLSYPYLKQPAGSLLTRRIRGPQQIEMLVNTYAITGNTEYLAKLLEGLGDPPTDDPKITEKGRARLQRIIPAVQVELARGCRRDPSIKDFCAAQVAQQQPPIAGRIEEILKMAEGTEPIPDAPPIAE
jgi:hypothetical protein